MERSAAVRVHLAQMKGLAMSIENSHRLYLLGSDYAFFTSFLGIYWSADVIFLFFNAILVFFVVFVFAAVKIENVCYLMFFEYYDS